MTLLARLILISIALTLPGCALTPKVEPNFWCLTNSPTAPTASQYATFSHQQKVDMATHNTYGAKACGWRPGA